VYVLEVNPRASRTVPYVSKATGRALAKIARAAWSVRRWRQGITGEVVPPYFSVKEAVFPFIKFPCRHDSGTGDESTGEVMGRGDTFAEAFLKSQLGAGVRLPKRAGCSSASESDKPRVLDVARTLVGLGFTLWQRVARDGAGRGRIACHGSEQSRRRPPATSSTCS